MYTEAQYTLLFLIIQKITQHMFACEPQAGGSLDCWYCPVLISNSLWNVIQKPEPGNAERAAIL